MSALYRTATLRRIETEWIARLGGGVLMARAAQAVADATARVARRLPRATPIVALVGPGNNGGDALLAISLLRDSGFPVAALTVNAGAPTARDALAVHQAWTGTGGELAPLTLLAEWLPQAPLIIDGLFGIGLARPISDNAARAVELLDAGGAGAIVAVDVPSGVDADTGAIVGGAGAPAIRADLTVTMIGDKPGLHTGAALDRVGLVQLAGLGIDPMPAADAVLFDALHARAGLRPRARDSHKGSFGSVLVIGGAEGTRGAALLAGLGAQSAGAGKVFVSTPDGTLFDPGQPQLMTRAFDAGFEGIDAICIGCGLGKSSRARDALQRALVSAIALVIDADALNLIAEDAMLGDLLASREAPTVLTPHPLEAARLLGLRAPQVQADRLANAAALAARTGAVTLLKGAGSVVAAADGSLTVNASGCAALATAGTGDVLAGVIAALLAQRLAAPEAARVGAWIHGAAGELWQLDHATGAGLSACALPALVTQAVQLR